MQGSPSVSRPIRSHTDARARRRRRGSHRRASRSGGPWPLSAPRPTWRGWRRDVDRQALRNGGQTSGWSSADLVAHRPVKNDEGDLLLESGQRPSRPRQEISEKQGEGIARGPVEPGAACGRRKRDHPPEESRLRLDAPFVYERGGGHLPPSATSLSPKIQRPVGREEGRDGRLPFAQNPVGPSIPEQQTLDDLDRLAIRRHALP